MFKFTLEELESDLFKDITIKEQLLESVRKYSKPMSDEFDKIVLKECERLTKAKQEE